eukprot:3512406-Amphidinium_carterae.1
MQEEEVPDGVLDRHSSSEAPQVLVGEETWQRRGRSRSGRFRSFDRGGADAPPGTWEVGFHPFEAHEGSAPRGSRTHSSWSAGVLCTRWNNRGRKKIAK